MEGIHSGKLVLATVEEAARANASDGVNADSLRNLAPSDGLLSPSQLQETQTLSISSFTELHAGWRIRTILQGAQVNRKEASFAVPSNFDWLRNSRGWTRTLSNDTRFCAGYLWVCGNILFSAREPVLRLRIQTSNSLIAAIGGATDQELARSFRFRLPQ